MSHWRFRIAQFMLLEFNTTFIGVVTECFANK